MRIKDYIVTVSYLIPTQIYHQLKYRIFGYKYPKTKAMPKPNENFNIYLPTLDSDKEYVERFKPDGILNNKIELLHETAEWKHGKWNYADKTHLWNFNLHYFEYGIALASKYKETDNKDYLDKLNELYKDWHDTCFAVHKGDAWHPYTISLRLKNLIIISGIIGKDRIPNDDIYKQYKFLIQNQEKHLLGNHYFENLETIYLCSRYFNDSKTQEKYEKKLINEIKEQILSDGMHFERSFMYHNLILEDLLRLWLVSEGKFKNILTENIKKMTDCVYSFEVKNRIPLFNDSGSNVAKTAGQLIKTVSHLLNYTPQKIQLTNAGYYRIENENFSLIMDTGEFAPSYISGHGHCDALSFELYYKGCPVLVNSGTYNYQTDKRQYFRSTKAHNTLQAIDVEQSKCWGEHRTAGRIKTVEAEQTDNKITGCVKDYKGNLLKREIEISEKEKIKITDSCSKPHKNYWHVHPSNEVKQLGANKLKIILPNGERLYIETDKELTKTKAFYSEEFGKIEETTAFESKSKVIEISI
jgi:hypothetical protein